MRDRKQILMRSKTELGGLFRSARTVLAMLLCGFGSIAVTGSEARAQAPGALPSAESCSCPPKPSIEDAFEEASLIFVGMARENTVNPLKKNDREVKFKVTRKLKGFEEVPGSGDSVIVYTPDSPTRCGIQFGDGLDYLVFAKGNPAYYQTTSCTRTDVLDKVLVDVHKLLRLTNSVDRQ